MLLIIVVNGQHTIALLSIAIRCRLGASYIAAQLPFHLRCYKLLPMSDIIIGLTLSNEHLPKVQYFFQKDIHAMPAEERQSGSIKQLYGDKWYMAHDPLKVTMHRTKSC